MLKQAARGASQAASCSGIWAPLSQNLAAGCAGLVQRLHTSANALATDVVVPSMGDSITEGSISSVLKAANDAVDEDEPILQIETDKVTIDVRAPHQGIVRAVLVKEEDMVNVGQTVAVLEDDKTDQAAPSDAPKQQQAAEGPKPEGATGSDASKKASPAPPQQDEQMDQLTDAASRKSDSAMRGGKARIRFPPRKTESGMTISSMPAQDQETYRARSAAAQQGLHGSQSSSGAVQESSKSFATGERRRGSFQEQVPRSVMSEEEMESVMLGGAPL